MTWLILAVFVCVLFVSDRRAQRVQLEKLPPLQRLTVSAILKNRD